VTETAPRNEALGPVRELGAATFSILRLLFLPIDEPSENMESIIDRCALAVQALCLAMLSFSQAHIGRIDPFFLEHHLSEVILGGAYESLMRMLTGYLTTSGQHYCQLVNLTCAGDMIDSKVMVFAERSVDSDKKFDLLSRQKTSLACGALARSFPVHPLDQKLYHQLSGCLELRFRMGSYTNHQHILLRCTGRLIQHMMCAKGFLLS
jgi:hypothetical protein